MIHSRSHCDVFRSGRVFALEITGDMWTRSLVLAVFAIGSVPGFVATHPDRPTDHVPAAAIAIDASPARPDSPESDVERDIRVLLARALADDLMLHDSEISFRVRGTDILLDGEVKSETARRRINDIAIAVPGVRSVSNAVRVAE